MSEELGILLTTVPIILMAPLSVKVIPLQVTFKIDLK